jgi:hypothetical protein
MAWSNAGELDRELRQKNVPVVGCAVGVKEIHPTQFAATFVPCDGKYVRIDWSRQPTPEEKEVALAVVRENASAGADAVPTDSEATVYPPDGPAEPMQLSPVLCYYWPRVWLAGRPGPSHDQIDLLSLHDLVYETDITQGLRAKAYRLGLFVFDFSRWRKDAEAPADGLNELDRLIERKMRRISVFNAHLICLYDAVARSQNFLLDKTLISHEDTISAGDFGDPFSGMGGGIGLPLTEICTRYTPDFMVTRGLHEVYAAQMKWSIQYHSRLVVTEDALKRSFATLAGVLDHSSDHSLLLVEILAHGCKAFEDHNYSLALVTAWAVIEKMLQARWHGYIDGERAAREIVDGQQVPRVNSDRAKKLKDGNNFTASVVTECLTCLSLLPFPLYKPLNQVRDARNKWMHELRPVTRDAASQAVQLAQDMLRQVEGIDLTIPVGTRLHT